jgi:hypothetical protein
MSSFDVFTSLWQTVGLIDELKVIVWSVPWHAPELPRNLTCIFPLPVVLEIFNESTMFNFGDNFMYQRFLGKTMRGTLSRTIA